MVRWIILLIVLAAIAVDVYIWHRAVGRWRIRAARCAYVVLAVAIDAGALGALLFFRAAEAGQGRALHCVMWAIALFFVTLVPKVVYALVSLMEYPVRRIGWRAGRGFSRAATALALCTLAAMLWSVTAGRSAIRVERVEITSPRLPEAFDGMRVVQFNDLHLGNLVGRDRFLGRVVETINSLEPHAVVQCGDLVNIHSGELDSTAMGILSAISAPEGVWAVVGNHDLGFYIRDTVRVPPAASLSDLLEKQRRLGWRMLRNQTDYIVRGGDSIAVSGVNYPSGDKRLNTRHQRFTGADIQKCFGSIPDSVFTIMLSHTPRLWEDVIAAGGADLTLSGHVHAMQMKLGIGKWVFSPARLMYKQWSGLYVKDGNALYINDGLGYVVYPMRINARPELTLITLRRR